MEKHGFGEDVYVELTEGNPMRNQIGALYIENELLNELKGFIKEMKDINEETPEYYPKEKIEDFEEIHDNIKKDLEETEDNYIYYVVF